MKKKLSVITLLLLFLVSCDVSRNATEKDVTDSSNSSGVDLDLPPVDQDFDSSTDEDTNKPDTDDDSSVEPDDNSSDGDPSNDEEVPTDEETSSDNDSTDGEESDLDNDTVEPADEDESVDDSDPVDPTDETIFDDVAHLSNIDLLKALYNKIKDHNDLGYDSARTRMFSEIDVHDGFVECYYTGRKIKDPGGIPSATSPEYMNTEHSWPKSQLTGDATSDIHHLFPTDARSNSNRGSYDFGEPVSDFIDMSCSWSCDAWGISNCICSTDPGFSRRGRDSSGDLVFEVRPERRGDIARAHFYMVARYRFDPYVEADDNNHNDAGSIDDIEEAFLRKWHKEDPVDEIEKRRNDLIEKYQGNRNPFVDRPDFVDKVSDF